MTDHANAPNPLDTAHHTFGRAMVLPIILFGAMLLFGILVSLRYAHGWVEIMSGPAVTIPMAADSLVAIGSALITAAGAVWFYLVRLAR